MTEGNPDSKQSEQENQMNQQNLPNQQAKPILASNETILFVGISSMLIHLLEINPFGDCFVKTIIKTIIFGNIELIAYLIIFKGFFKVFHSKITLILKFFVKWILKFGSFLRIPEHKNKWALGLIIFFGIVILIFAIRVSSDSNRLQNNDRISSDQFWNEINSLKNMISEQEHMDLKNEMNNIHLQLSGMKIETQHLQNQFHELQRRRWHMEERVAEGFTNE